MNCLIWAYRRIFFCKRRVIKYFNLDKPTELRIEIPVHKLPWLWIGAEFSKDKIETVTEIVNQFVKYGLPINSEFLEEVTGYTGATWKYVDSQTLEEREFPTEGIVINGPE